MSTILVEITGLKGTARWLETHATPLRNEQDEVTALLAITRDVTEHKRAAKELQQSEERFRVIFERSVVSSSISTPAGKILACHESFARLFGFASVQEVIDSSASSFFTDSVAREHYLELVREQRRLEHYELELRRRDRLIGEHIELESVPAFDLGTVNADQGQIEQVIMNLAVNARDAMPDGGKLTIETKNVTLLEDGKQRECPISAGDFVLSVVTDTGCGMDSGTQARVFEPFLRRRKWVKERGWGYRPAMA